MRCVIANVLSLGQASEDSFQEHYKRLIDSLLAQHGPLHAIGIQAHEPNRAFAVDSSGSTKCASLWPANIRRFIAFLDAGEAKRMQFHLD